MKIVADPNIPFVREAFGSLGEVTLIPGRQMSAATVRDATVLLVRSVTPVNASLLDGSRVQFVATATIGTDHVDTAWLAARRIGFASAAGSNANSVAEYVTAAMLELGRRHGFRLRNKTLGVVGIGNVGSKVVHCANALGMRVLANDPPLERLAGRRAESDESSPTEPSLRDGAAVCAKSGHANPHAVSPAATPTAPSVAHPETRRAGASPTDRFVSLDRVIAEADFITLHVPLTKSGPDATRHLLDPLRLDRRPILINSSRGAVLDNPALLQAIDNKKLAGCVLDVWEGEPNLLPGLLAKTDLGTPHIAGYSFDGKVNGARMIHEAACRFLGIAPAWQPQLPLPAVPRIAVDVGRDEDEEEVLRRVIASVYDIIADDAALRRAGSAGFDKLRAEYPIRREFFNTAVTLRGASESLRAKFTALGFRVE